jgi:hypothetical protein
MTVQVDESTPQSISQAPSLKDNSDNDLSSPRINLHMAPFLISIPKLVGLFVVVPEAYVSARPGSGCGNGGGSPAVVTNITTSQTNCRTIQRRRQLSPFSVGRKNDVLSTLYPTVHRIFRRAVSRISLKSYQDATLYGPKNKRRHLPCSLSWPLSLCN